MRRAKFQNGEFYHIFNRGNDKRKIFLDEKDYVRFLTGIREFNRPDAIDSLYRLNQLRKENNAVVTELRRSSSVTTTPLVDIICYCLNSNHFHILAKQVTEKGISKFMHKLGYGYTRYFNTKHKRSGSLFQGTYKAVHVKSDEQLQYLSGYINGNPEIHKLAKADDYKWSSYPDYLNTRNGNIANKNIIIKEFKNIDEYREYVNIIIEDSKSRKDEIKAYHLE